MQSKMKLLFFIGIEKNLKVKYSKSKHNFLAQKILIYFKVYSEHSQTSKISKRFGWFLTLNY